MYRLRNCSITAKGVVNYGDSIIDRKSRSNTSINSTASRSAEHLTYYKPALHNNIKSKDKKNDIFNKINIYMYIYILINNFHLK